MACIIRTGHHGAKRCPFRPARASGRTRSSTWSGRGGWARSTGRGTRGWGATSPIKVLPAEVGADPERLRRFEQEARAVAALNHPNILTVFDVGTHEGTPYVVMELLQGETLREMVSRRAPTQRQVLVLPGTGRPGAGGGAREGDRAPGREARERVRDDGRTGEGPGLRAGEGGRPAHERERGGDGVLADGRRARGGDGGVHVPGAGAGAGGGPADGRLLAGGGAVRAAGREAPVPSGDDGRDADGDPGGDAVGALDAGARDRAGGVGDRAAVPGEGAGGSVRLGAGRAGGAGGGASGAGGVGESSGGGGAEPVPGARELHGEGRGSLLRAGGGDPGPLGEDGEPPAPRDHRPFGGGQDVVRPRGGDPGSARGLGCRRARRPARARPSASRAR